MIGAVLVGLSFLSVLPGIVFVIIKYLKWKEDNKNEKFGFLDFYFKDVTDPLNSPLLNKERGQITPWIPFFAWFLFVNFVMIIYVSASV
jgi:hypothetical protein